MSELCSAGTDIPTSNAVLILEGPAVATDRIDTQDGINTIGFTSDEAFRDSWATASAWWGWDDDGINFCDVKVSPYFVKNWAPQDFVRLLEVAVVHEIGHCLGLLHSEPHPMPLWTDLPVTRGFRFPAGSGDVLFEFLRPGATRGRHNGSFTPLSG